MQELVTTLGEKNIVYRKNAKCDRFNDGPLPLNESRQIFHLLTFIPTLVRVDRALLH